VIKHNLKIIDANKLGMEGVTLFRAHSPSSSIEIEEPSKLHEVFTLLGVIVAVANIIMV
jgi:hypothetical protein